jgi:mono/diheme cytochrome c family protein
MRRSCFVGGIVGLLLAGGVAVAAPAAPEKVDAAAAQRGAVSYQRYCTACHGPTAHGDGPVASALRTAPADLTTISKRNNGSFPYERVERFIDGRESTRAHGTPDMPVWGEVFKKTQGTGAATPSAAVRELTHYLWSLQPAR